MFGFAKKSKPNAKKANKPKKKVAWANDKGGELANIRYVTPVGRMTKTGAAKSTTRGGASLTIKQRLALGDRRASGALASVRADLAEANHGAKAAKKKLDASVRELYIARSMKLNGKNLAKFENAVARSENRLLKAEIERNLAKMKSKSTRSLLL